MTNFFINGRVYELVMKDAFEIPCDVGSGSRGPSFLNQIYVSYIVGL